MVKCMFCKSLVEYFLIMYGFLFSSQNESCHSFASRLRFNSIPKYLLLQKNYTYTHKPREIITCQSAKNNKYGFTYFRFCYISLWFWWFTFLPKNNIYHRQKGVKDVTAHKIYLIMYLTSFDQIPDHTTITPTYMFSWFSSCFINVSSKWKRQAMLWIT